MELSVDNRLAFVAHGARRVTPDAETVVFVHGAGQDHSIWVLPSRHFARKGLNALALDLPGHGKSDGPVLPSIEDMAAWVIRVLDELGIEQTAIVGHSMGSLVALAAAGSYPERIRSVAMIGTSVPMPVSDALLAASADNGRMDVEMLTYWGHGPTAHLGGNATPGMWMLGCSRRLLERAAPGVIHADLRACNEYAAGFRHAGQVVCPTMLILGQRDIMTPVRGAQKLAENLAAVEIVVVPGAGHALLAECPEAVLDALLHIVPRESVTE